MKWKEEIVRDLFREPDAKLILNIKLPSRPTEDFIAWFFEKSGVFSVRSAYKLAKELAEEGNGSGQSSSGSQESRPIWKNYWKLPLPHKVLIFGWKVINNGLATQVGKKSRSIVVDSTCTICGREDETIEHALLWCNHAATLREAMRLHWQLPDEEQLRNFTPLSLLQRLDALSTDASAQLLLLLWRTWHVRNTITHGNDKLSFEGSIKFLQKYWTELCEVRQQGSRSDQHGKLPCVDSLTAGKQKRPDKEQEKWMAPPEDWLKINVDGALDERTGEGGIGVVIRNHRGEVILTAWRFALGEGSAEEVEAQACKYGLLLAAEWCPQKAVLVTDCSSVATMLASKNGGRSPLKFIIDETIETGHRLSAWTVIHKRRESNRVAHELAQLAKRTRHSAVWQFAAPLCVEQIIARECNQISE
jgi:ribonuclease HI